MIHMFNGFYKNNSISLDILMVNPSEYGLNEELLWFRVDISIANKLDLLPDFYFYLINSDRKVFNYVSQIDLPDGVEVKADYSIIIGFEFISDYFYNIPCFGFHCDLYKNIELVELAC